MEDKDSLDVITDPTQFNKKNYDIDSFTIVSKSLRRLHPGMVFDVYPFDGHSSSLENQKLFTQLQKTQPHTLKWELSNTYDIGLGGTGLDKIFAIVHISSINEDLLKEYGLRGFFMRAIQKSIEAMPKNTKTFKINSKISKVTTATVFKIVSDEWERFCEIFKSYIDQENGEEVDIFYYKCAHNLKSVFGEEIERSPAIRRIALSAVDATKLKFDDNPQEAKAQMREDEDILFIQVHCAVNLSVYPRHLLLIDKLNFERAGLWTGHNVRWHPNFYGLDSLAFSGIEKYHGCPDVTDMHSYLHNNHAFLHEHTNCIFTHSLQGTDPKAIFRGNINHPKIENIKRFQQSVIECATLRIEAVLTWFDLEGKWSEEMSTRIRTYINKLIGDLLKHRAIRVMQRSSYDDFIGKFKGIYSLDDAISTFEKPLNFGALSTILKEERLYDTLFWNLPVIGNEAKSIDERDLCKKCCTNRYLRFDLRVFYNYILQVDWSKKLAYKIGGLKQDEDMRKIMYILKIYAFYSVNYGLKQDLLIDEINVTKHLCESYVSTHKERRQSWGFTVDYYDVVDTILSPKTNLGKFILSFFYDRNSIQSFTNLAQIVMKCLTYTKISALPSKFINNSLDGEKINDYSYWSRVVREKKHKLPDNPTKIQQSSTDTITVNRDGDTNNMAAPSGAESPILLHVNPEEDELVNSKFKIGQFKRSQIQTDDNIVEVNSLRSSMERSTSTTTQTTLITTGKRRKMAIDSSIDERESTVDSHDNNERNITTQSYITGSSSGSLRTMVTRTRERKSALFPHYTSKNSLQIDSNINELSSVSQGTYSSETIETLNVSQRAGNCLRIDEGVTECIDETQISKTKTPADSSPQTNPKIERERPHIIRDSTLPPTIKGFENTHLTCYANSVLAILFNIPEIGHLIKCKKLCCGNVWSKLLCHKFDEYHSTRSTYINVTEFCRELAIVNTNFVLNQQHDAGDFLLTFLNRYRNHNPDPLEYGNKLFLITKRITQNCIICNYRNAFTETDFCLFLPFNTQCTLVSVRSLLRNYFQSELMTCPHCNGCTCIPSLKLRTPPRYLILHLLPYNNDGMKLDIPVSIESHLDLSKLGVTTREWESCNYHLNSWIEHIGTTIQQGHYIANIVRDGRIYSINNEEVTDVTDKKGFPPISSDVYIIFYELHPPVSRRNQKESMIEIDDSICEAETISSKSMDSSLPIETQQRKKVASHPIPRTSVRQREYLITDASISEQNTITTASTSEDIYTPTDAMYPTLPTNIVLTPSNIPRRKMRYKNKNVSECKSTQQESICSIISESAQCRLAIDPDITEISSVTESSITEISSGISNMEMSKIRSKLSKCPSKFAGKNIIQTDQTIQEKQSTDSASNPRKISAQEIEFLLERKKKYRSQILHFSGTFFSSDSSLDEE